METLNNIKENIKEKFNISESGKVNNFLGFYYELGHYAKVTYAKMTINKYLKKLVDGYENYTGSDLKVQKSPGALVTTISKSDSEETYNINKYRSFVLQLM